ncbi:hypothetical protein WJX73_004184 [Symbiochloris irregularis]|uniref:CDP-diacylglycerol--glycerol-3-phosphate 3-phosphatidyltransferase n=1 Tax=Symbiochloris irregularis TaxID=706552 RepID=A0AAW1PUZ9_9CHLO
MANLARSSEEIKRVPLFHVTSSESFDSPIDRRSDYYRQKVREGSGPLTERSPAQPQRLLTPPNVLTLFRIALVPVFAILWFVPHSLAPAACAATFHIAALTDWADGYLARKLNLATAFGAFLDPVADKIMVATALILLSTDPPHPVSQRQMVVLVVVIICRELTMASLREWAACRGKGARQAVKVNSLGKWKTAMQMVAMSLLLACRHGDAWLGTSPEALLHLRRTAQWSLFILWAGAFFAVWSLVNYMTNIWLFFRYPDGPPANATISKPPAAEPVKKVP